MEAVDYKNTLLECAMSDDMEKLKKLYSEIDNEISELYNGKFKTLSIIKNLQLCGFFDEEMAAMETHLTVIEDDISSLEEVFEAIKRLKKSWEA